MATESINNEPCIEARCTINPCSPGVVDRNKPGAGESATPMRQPALPPQAQQGNGEATPFQGPEEGGHGRAALGGP